MDFTFTEPFRKVNWELVDETLKSRDVNATIADVMYGNIGGKYCST